MLHQLHPAVNLIAPTKAISPTVLIAIPAPVDPIPPANASTPLIVPFEANNAAILSETK